jgi:hypothetical protein
MSQSQRYYTPTFKQRVLTNYIPHSRGNGFHSLAKQFDITGGAPLVHYWYQAWDGTPSSLQNKCSPGRPTILNTHEINQHIGAVVRRKNRQPRAAHYTNLMHDIKRKSGKQVSLRTIQRYGKETLHIKDQSTTKREERECRSTYINTTTNTVPCCSLHS